jgi:threonine aldolase
LTGRGSSSHPPTPASPWRSIATLRHQFGSALYQGWESAAVALHYLEGFPERYRTAVGNGETLLKLLEGDRRIRIERFPAGSNIFGVSLASGASLDQLRERLAKAGIVLAGAKNATQSVLQINESINRRSPEQLAQAFANALS